MNEEPGMFRSWKELFYWIVKLVIVLALFGLVFIALLVVAGVW